MIKLDKIAKINVFKVPDNYFDGLALSIQQRIEEPSLSLEKQNNFSTPKGYFEELSSKIFSKIDQIESKNIILEDLERINVFKIPENYFQELEVNSGIERFDKENIFNVPKGYFETLTEKILSKTFEKQAKVIQVNWFQKNTVRWSAAASIILMVGLWFAIPQLNKDKTELALEKVSNADIKNYLETQDLSYLEYEASEKVQIVKTLDSKTLEGLKIDKQEILEHLENQDLEEDI